VLEAFQLKSQNVPSYPLFTPDESRSHSAETGHICHNYSCAISPVGALLTGSLERQKKGELQKRHGPPLDGHDDVLVMESVHLI
jgi:hypothetical protein